MAEFKKKTMEKFRSFRHHPGSFLLWLITMLAAVCTICVLGFLVIYILIKGVPHLTPSLFAWTYDSNNVSMMPTYHQYDLDDRTYTAHCGTAWYFRGGLSGGVCEERQ